MNRLKAILLKILIISAVIFTSSQVFSETMKIAYFDLPPHSMIKNGKHTGALIDYWNNYFAPAMGVKLEWIGPLPPLRMLNSLKQGTINTVALLAKNKERLKLYDFPKKPFFQMNAGLAVKKTNKINKIKSIEDIVGLKIGFFQKGFIPPVMRDSRIVWDKITAVNWQKQNLIKLNSGRIDAVLNPESFSLLYEIKQNNMQDRVKVLIVPETTTGNFPMFCKKDNGHFLKKYMQAQIKVDKQVQYKDILKKYIK